MHIYEALSLRSRVYLINQLKRSLTGSCRLTVSQKKEKKRKLSKPIPFENLFKLLSKVNDSMNCDKLIFNVSASGGVFELS